MTVPCNLATRLTTGSFRRPYQSAYARVDLEPVAGNELLSRMPAFLHGQDSYANIRAFAFAYARTSNQASRSSARFNSGNLAAS